MVSKWAGSIEIGVTTHSPTDLGNISSCKNIKKLATFYLYRFPEHDD